MQEKRKEFLLNRLKRQKIRDVVSNLDVEEKQTLKGIILAQRKKNGRVRFDVKTNSFI